MTTAAIDPQEQAFVETALAAASRSHKRDRIRVIFATIVAVAAVAWFASRPSSPALGIEATICIVIGAMITLVTAKLRWLIQRNTVLILQAIEGKQSQPQKLASSETNLG